MNPTPIETLKLTPVSSRAALLLPEVGGSGFANGNWHRRLGGQPRLLELG
jgi:hypothetical protein